VKLNAYGPVPPMAVSVVVYGKPAVAKGSLGGPRVKGGRTVSRPRETRQHWTIIGRSQSTHFCPFRLKPMP
jgi:hypothetical protein